MSKLTKNFASPTDEEIAFYAYCLWEADGRPEGKDVEHWFQAKAQLAAHTQNESELLKVRKTRTTGVPKIAATPATQKQSAQGGIPKGATEKRAAKSERKGGIPSQPVSLRSAAA